MRTGRLRLLDQGAVVGGDRIGHPSGQLGLLCRGSELADPDRRLAARLHHLIGKPLQLLAVARVERKRGESVEDLRGAEPPQLRQSALRGVDGSRGNR